MLALKERTLNSFDKNVYLTRNSKLGFKSNWQRVKNYACHSSCF